jgi:hypothetical protein
MLRQSLILWSIIFLVISPIPHVSHAQTTDGDVTFRFVNLTGSPVDLYRNGNIAFFGNNTGQPSAERVIEAGSQTFQIYAENKVPTAAEPLAELSIEPAAQSEFLLIASQREGQISLQTLEYSRDPIRPQFARLEILHLAESLPDFTLIGQNQDVLVEKAAQGAITRVDIPAGNYQAVFRDAANSTADLAARAIITRAGQLHTILVYGTEDVRVLQIDHPLEGLAEFRFVHAMRLTGAVDVYFDLVLMFSGIKFQEATDYILTEPGTYTIGIYQKGTLPNIDLPLWSGEVQLSSTSPLTGVASGENNLRMITHLDDHLLIPAEKGRIRFINAALNLLSLTVQDDQGDFIVREVEYVLGSRHRNIDAGERSLIFRETEGDTYATLSAFPLEANHYYTFVVVGNALIEGNVTVIVLDWTWHDQPET